MLLDINSKEKLNEMIEAGVFYGHHKSKTHARMKDYIIGRKNEIDIIDPEDVVESINKAAQFLKEIIKKKGIILWVGTQPAAKELIQEIALKLNNPYVTFRWLGGTLTNFEVIRKRVNYYENLKINQEKGELNKYTKKEQLKFAKEINKLQRNFEGLKSLVKLPDAVFVVDGVLHKTAVIEANKLNIPLLGIIDTDDNPDLFNYPIFANDDSKTSIAFILNAIFEYVSNNNVENMSNK